MKNRYYFFKKLFKEYVIVFEKNKKYVSLGIDNILIKYLNDSINYIVINNDNKIDVYEFNKNNYRLYVYKVFLNNLLERYLEVIDED